MTTGGARAGYRAGQRGERHQAEAKAAEPPEQPVRRLARLFHVSIPSPGWTSAYAVARCTLPYKRRMWGAEGTVSALSVRRRSWHDMLHPPCRIRQQRHRSDTLRRNSEWTSRGSGSSALPRRLCGAMACGRRARVLSSRSQVALIRSASLGRCWPCALGTPPALLARSSSPI